MADGDVLAFAAVPYSLEAEASIIGALLFDNTVYEIARDHVRESDFYAPAHAAAWRVISQVIDSGKVADAVTLQDAFGADELLREAGGPAYALELLRCAAYGPELLAYSGMVADMARRRALIEAAGTLRTAAMGASADDALAMHEEALDGVREMRVGAAARVTTAADIKFGKREPGSYAETGYPSLDRDIGGLEPGTVTVIAARPSMGKSAIAIDILMNMARGGLSVGYFSLEMPAADVKLRQCIYEAWHIGGANLPTIGDVKQGRAWESHMAALERAGQSPAMRRFYVCDRGGLSVADMGAMLRLWKRHAARAGNPRPSVICIDHIGHAVPGLRTSSLYEKTSIVSNQLLALARNQGVAVLALSQLNRASVGEKRKPGLQDLRDSGKIEEDAATVLLLHREDYYAERAVREDGLDDEERHIRMARLAACRGQAELIIGKNRNGPLGTVSLSHSVGHNLFRDPEWRAS